MIGFLVYLVVIGIVAGYLARILVPGPDPLTFGQTVLLGIVGSFVGGFLGSLLFEGEIEFSAGGVILSIIGAVIALLVYRRVRTTRT